MISNKTRSGAAAAAGAIALLVTGAGAALADVPHPGSPEANQPEYWETFLEDAGYTDVSCEKVEDDYDEASWTADQDWAAVILKAGSDESTDGAANDIFYDVLSGATLVHASGKDISHVIACLGTEPEEPGEPGEPGEPNPPIETDGPAQAPGMGAGLIGGLAALAGGTALLAAGVRRRTGEK